MRLVPPRPRPSAAPPLAGVAEAVLASARLLQQAEPGASTHGLLRGKNLGLVCESEEDADAILFRNAASALGASVSHIRSDLSVPGGAAGAELVRTARILGRLYDGIECQGLAATIVRQLRRDAGVPVFEGLACTGHPTALLAQRLAGPGSAATKRQLILQAVLLFELR
jgi:ornithine carbamoyltransferase